MLVLLYPLVIYLLWDLSLRHLLPTVYQGACPKKEPEHSCTAKSCLSDVSHLQKTRDLVSKSFVCAITHT